MDRECYFGYYFVSSRLAEGFSNPTRVKVIMPMMSR
jgi:hypothetical protein